MSGILRAIIEEKLLCSEEEIHKIAVLDGIDLRADSYRIILAGNTGDVGSCEEYKKSCVDFPYRCRSFFQKQGVRTITETDYSGMCVILLMDVTQRKSVEKLCKELMVYLERHQMPDMSISVGKSVASIAHLAHSYRTALDALSYRTLYDGKNCIFCEDLQTMMNISTLQSVVKPDHMLQAFREGDMARLRELVTLQAEEVRALSGDSIEGRHPTSIRRMFVELTVYILHIASDMGVDADVILNGIDPYNFLLANDKSTPMIIDWFMSMCSELRKAIDEKTRTKEQNIICKACDYIEKNITRYDLSLDDVAAAVGITASYLSKLFHKEREIVFSKYIVRRRMEIAHGLLVETELPVKEISVQAGFASANYFGTVFKREFGISPQVYRTQNVAANGSNMSKNQ